MNLGHIIIAGLHIEESPTYSLTVPTWLTVALAITHVAPTPPTVVRVRTSIVAVTVVIQNDT